jgi:hypothetical protein
MFLIFDPPKLGQKILMEKKSNKISIGIMRKNYNWEQYFIALFHVSEHVDHFKALKKL